MGLIANPMQGQERNFQPSVRDFTLGTHLWPPWVCHFVWPVSSFGHFSTAVMLWYNCISFPARLKFHIGISQFPWCLHTVSVQHFFVHKCVHVHTDERSQQSEEMKTDYSCPIPHGWLQERRSKTWRFHDALGSVMASYCALLPLHTQHIPRHTQHIRVACTRSVSSLMVFMVIRSTALVFQVTLIYWIMTPSARQWCLQLDERKSCELLPLGEKGWFTISTNSWKKTEFVCHFYSSTTKYTTDARRDGDDALLPVSEGSAHHA